MEDELLLLGLLSGSAMHGYKLNDVIERRLPRLSRLKPSTAYSQLDRLAERGLVSRAMERVGRRPERKVFSLTVAGRERFVELLRENLRSADVPAYAGELGVLFFRALSRADVLALLGERRAATEARLPELTRIRATHPPGTPGYLTADHALAHLRAELDWLQRVLVDGLYA